jgi:hypothetical protein
MAWSGNFWATQAKYVAPQPTKYVLIHCSSGSMRAKKISKKLGIAMLKSRTEYIELQVIRYLI